MLETLLLRILYPHPRQTDFSLLNRSVYNNTSSFFTELFDEALRSPDPHAEIHRYAIESITLLNDVQAPQHERLCVLLSDTRPTSSSPNTGLLDFKCSASDEYTPEYFAEHSDNRNVLDAILSAVEDSMELMSPSASPSCHKPSIDPTQSPTRPPLTLTNRPRLPLN